MIQGEHSAILLTFIKLPFVIKIFVLSVFEWPLKTGFIVLKNEIVKNQPPLNKSMQVTHDAKSWFRLHSEKN